MSLRVPLFVVVMCACAFGAAPGLEMALEMVPEMPPGVASQTVLDRYLENTKLQAEKMKGVSMDVDISAELPKLKKKGKLQALRTITRLGKITYDAIRFEGDNTIKKELIARYMSTEVEATDKTAPPITPEFYKFRYKGLVERDDVQVHWFQITPKKKLVGTFKGDILLEKDTCLTLRESGRLVKNPSVFIKQFDFVRLYEIKDGISVPKETTGLVETRLWGRAEMNIHFSNFTRIAEAASGLGEGQFDKTPRD